MTTSTPVLDHRPAHVDPRIRARRIEVQRGAGRRRLQRLLDVALVLTVAGGFAVAVRTPLLDVDEVLVTGTAHTPAELVKERSGINPGDQLIDLDLRAAGERIAALPWVDEVRLHRKLDGQVAVAITERVAVGVVGEGATAVLIDGQGRALALSSTAPELATSLVHLGGAAIALVPGEVLGGDVEGMLALSARLVAAGVATDLLLEEGADGVVTGRFSSGVVVQFGPADLLDAKVRSLVTVLDQVDLTCAAAIDVRSPGSPVLTRKEGCS